MQMDKEKELPKRKHPRLDNYDYSSAGAYFITICTQNRRCVLSRIVGRGLAPAETTAIEYTYFRDIHKMSDAFEEPFLEKVCTGWKAEYFTPPVVDEYLFRKDGSSGVMSLDGAFERMDATALPGDRLAVVAMRSDGTPARIVFDERGISVNGTGMAVEYPQPFRATARLHDGRLSFEFQGFRYAIGYAATVEATQSGFAFRPVDGRIRLDLSLPDEGKQE